MSNAPDKIYLQWTGSENDTSWNNVPVCEHGIPDEEYIRADIHQAEIDALHAECDSLTKMLEPQKVVKAEEVTAPGYYMMKYRNEPMFIAEITEDEIDAEDLDQDAQYIGPLKWPEV